MEERSSKRNILIIYPHWYPSNLAGVHRPRLIGNYLKDFGWQPYVLTVNSKYYEEAPDPDMESLFSKSFIEYRVNAFPVTKLRVIGDIGLRALIQLYKKALEIIRKHNIDFVWIPIPSFYVALLGRFLYERTKVPYCIDYIDPWVRDISNRRNWRNILSNMLARVLEPIAIRKASLITGVSEGYYRPALERNFKSENTPPHLSFSYGFDPHDYDIRLEHITFPWSVPACKPMVYAGAFLPQSHLFVRILFTNMRQLINEGSWDKDIHLFFLGTGSYSGKSIADYAKDIGVDHYVHEVRERFPFLHILNFLTYSHSVMVIGSTEKHYTASKVYQAILCKRPVFAILHKESTACLALREAKADNYTIEWHEELEDTDFQSQMKKVLLELNETKKDVWNPQYDMLEKKYSSRVSAKLLTEALEKVLEKQSA